MDTDIYLFIYSYYLLDQPLNPTLVQPLVQSYLLKSTSYNPFRFSPPSLVVYGSGIYS